MKANSFTLKTYRAIVGKLLIVHLLWCSFHSIVQSSTTHDEQNHIFEYFLKVREVWFTSRNILFGKLIVYSTSEPVLSEPPTHPQLFTDASPSLYVSARIHEYVVQIISFYYCDNLVLSWTLLFYYSHYFCTFICIDNFSYIPYNIKLRLWISINFFIL